MIMKKVTISFPVYNVKDTVEVALKSMLNQNYDNIEFLIVDDKGSDNSMEIITEIVKSHPKREKVRFIEHSQNSGLGSVRNTSIESATGDYIYFMDSDDELTLDCISLLVGEALNNDAEVVVGSAQICNNGIPTSIIGFDKKYIFDSTCKLSVEVFENGFKYPVYMWNKLFRLDFLHENDIKCVHPYVEDDVFTFKTIMSVQKCICIPNVTYYYKINSQSITSTLMKKDIPLKTADIYVDIFDTKKRAIETFENKKLRYSILLDIVNFAILRATAVNDSGRISEIDKREKVMMLLTYPAIKLSYISDRRLKVKGIFINFLKLLPYSLKLRLILMTNRFRVHEKIS